MKALALILDRMFKNATQANLEEFAQQLADDAGAVAAAPVPPTLSLKQARAEAEALLDAADRLEELLTNSRITHPLALDGHVITNSLALNSRVINGRECLDAAGLAALRGALPLLRADLHAVLIATTGDESAPQLDLPQAGDKPSPARRVASVVLARLHKAGAKITAAANTSPAVEVVAAVFQLPKVAIEANARHHVKEWIKRHPGGRV